MSGKKIAPSTAQIKGHSANGAKLGRPPTDDSRYLASLLLTRLKVGTGSTQWGPANVDAMSRNCPSYGRSSVMERATMIKHGVDGPPTGGAKAGRKTDPLTAKIASEAERMLEAEYPHGLHGDSCTLVDATAKKNASKGEAGGAGSAAAAAGASADPAAAGDKEVLNTAEYVTEADKVSASGDAINYLQGTYSGIYERIDDARICGQVPLLATLFRSYRRRFFSGDVNGDGNGSASGEDSDELAAAGAGAASGRMTPAQFSARKKALAKEGSVTKRAKKAANAAAVAAGRDAYRGLGTDSDEDDGDKSDDDE